MLPNIFTLPESFITESNVAINNLQLAYHTYGTLNTHKSNVVWVFHALTANSNVAEWWNGLVGEGKLLSPEKYFIVCVNMPGSHYGSTNALSIHTTTGGPFYHQFPWFTTRDMARAYDYLRKHLAIEKIHIGIGGSMGGQQLLEWAIEQPSLFENIIPIATNAQHSSWGIAFNSSQRLAIEADTTWLQQQPNAGMQGMQVARSIALLSYRHYNTYTNTQKGITTATENNTVQEQVFKAETYQRYQGEKLAKRFNAFSYYFLSKGMDSHNVGRARVSAENALQQITAATLVIGVDSDILFPVNEQQFLAAYINNAVYTEIKSLYGHDGFLLEYEQLEKVIREFLADNEK
jgi:homoserine O-acetyltransferase/O-succinyltransferase